MPMVNEHRARLTDPDQYDEWGRDNDKFGPGIHAIWGIKKGPPRKSELQAIAFDASKFTPAEAKKWCADHDYKVILFEPASGAESAARDVICLSQPGAFKDGITVEREAGIIRNASVITRGPAIGHNFDIDDVTLRQVHDSIKLKLKGAKCRLTHPEASGGLFGGGRDGVEFLVGRVIKPRIEGDRVRADVLLGKYAEHSPSGNLREYLLGVAQEDPEAIGLSMMFKPGKFEERRDEKNQTLPSACRIEDVLAVDFVGDPAANPTGLLSGGLKAGDAPSPQLGGPIMADSTPVVTPEQKPAETLAAAAPLVVPIPKVDVEALKAQAAQEALALDQKRRADIMALASTEKLDETWARGLCDRGVTLAQATELVKLAVMHKPLSIAVGQDLNKGTLGEAMRDAICLRAGAKVEKPHERAHQFRGLSVLEMFRLHLESLGVPDARFLSKSRLVDLLGPRRLVAAYPHVAGLAMSTSDFSHILADAVNKTLLAAYQEAPKSWQVWARRASAADFKTIYRTSLSEAPALAARTESGEIHYVSLLDSVESYALVEYAGGIKLTRKAIVNDDLDAFSRIPTLQANAAARKEDDVAYAILTANAAMHDTGLLFNVTAVTTAGGHANLAGAGAALSVTALAAGTAAMGLQKGPKLAAYLNLEPAFLLVPVTKSVVAVQLVGAPNDPAIAAPTPNPFANRLQVVKNARLDANSTTAWYLLADFKAGQVDTVEVCFLDDEPTPVLAQETDFDTEDMKFKVRHTVAAKAIDWRGMYKNPGA